MTMQESKWSKDKCECGAIEQAECACYCPSSSSNEPTKTTIKQATGTYDAAYWLEPSHLTGNKKESKTEIEQKLLALKKLLIEKKEKHTSTITKTKEEKLYRKIDIRFDTPQEGDEILTTKGDWVKRTWGGQFLPGNRYRRPIESKQE